MDFTRPLRVVTPTLDGDVLAVLAGSDEEFSGRRIHRLLGHSSEPGVRKAAERLVEQGIVLRRQAGRANLYRLNRSHLAAPQIEGLATLQTRLISRLQEAIAEWKLPPHSALLFGSVARGEGRAGSDLDILVVRGSGVDEDSSEWRGQLASLESDAGGWTGNDTRIVEYDDEEIAGGNRLVDEALTDGIELYGSRRRLRKLIEGRA
jgi:predicted nucleotidyltransferase